MVSESIVFRENDPLSPPDFSEPVLIRRIWREMIIMDFDFGACRAKRTGNHVLSEGTIYKKGVLLRRP
jgi:hypothetical protein